MCSFLKISPKYFKENFWPDIQKVSKKQYLDNETNVVRVSLFPLGF